MRIGWRWTAGGVLEACVLHCKSLIVHSKLPDLIGVCWRADNEICFVDRRRVSANSVTSR